MTGICEATISALHGSQLTRHFGRPTRNAIKKTRKEIGLIYAAAKTTHEDFTMGFRFGYAAAIMTLQQFITAFNSLCPAGDEVKDDWEFVFPQRPLTTNPAIVETTTDTDRSKMVNEWAQHVR